MKGIQRCKAYSEDLQLAAIRDVLSGSHSIREATKKYHISSKSVLTRWISKYTNGVEINLLVKYLV
ncbi:helix-turn-helix domain-containing protein [Paenibacillus larvae]|uniref:helix-turn-helix domain-containing protein n=1 Tax=Paenibacillus larvae TaxID=1464 RepID=UPI0037C82CDB